VISPLFDLQGRTTLVTGAGGRLGRAFARALAQAGARVALTGRDEAELRQAADAAGDAVIATVPLDLTERDAVGELFEAVGPIDVLVNNAGTASPAPFGEITAEEVQRVLAVNVTAALLCAQTAAPVMRERGGGKIVNVGSIYGIVGPQPAIYEGSPDMVQASPVYAAGKSALVNLTRDLAVRLAPWNIQVNVLSPGGIEADQPDAFKRRYAERVPAGRMGRPEDLAGTLVYLAGPASDYVTGQNILVDGGFTSW
jgi:NAD(P)-dependent dehydrogenase (short-subunit alcohol dehydrogenase family)